MTAFLIIVGILIVALVIAGIGAVVNSPKL